MGVIIFDLFTVGLIGCASVIALKAFRRGGHGSEFLLLVTVFALLGVAGVLQVVKLVNPPPSSAATPVPVPSPLPAEGKKYELIYDLPPPGNNPNQYDSEAEVTIDGISYPARGVQLCKNAPKTWEYAINDKYAAFQARLILAGSSSPDAEVNFSVVVGNETISKRVKSENTATIDVPLRGVKQLTLVTDWTNRPGSCENLIAQWVDAKVVPN